MAAWLLKGGKMLAKTCKECGCPVFEYKGRTFCVVCEEKEEAKKTGVEGATGEAGVPAGKESAICTCAGMPVTGLGEALSATLVTLCERIGKEPDPERCLVLMNALKKGIEAMQLLKI